MTSVATQSTDRSSAVAIFLAQARLRLVAGLPVTSLAWLLVWSTGSASRNTLTAIWCLHIGYMVLSYVLARHLQPRFASACITATAILDPMILTIWLPWMGEYGSLVVCFYLFTTLGFGFRVGVRAMTVSQITSLVAFAFTYAVTPFWQQHYLIWWSCAVSLVVVPLYASVLIKQLQEARTKAENESRFKTALLARVSHELRTPLTGIVASAELLAAESVSLSATKRADDILGMSRDLLREIDALLDQAKYESGKVALDLVPTSLPALVNRLIATFEPMAAKKGLALSVTIDKSITDLVSTDDHYLGRVLTNLIGNAIKFTDNGAVSASLTLLEETSSSYCVRFAVKDSGIGIAKQAQETVFEPFSQADNSISRKYGGTGLGLSISSEVVKLMGGQIQLESDLGKGTRVWFDVTFAREKIDHVRNAANDQNVVRGKRMLVADDNATILGLMRELLLLDGHSVVEATSGHEAMDALASQQFDLVFLDFNMGEVSGETVLQTYRFGTLKPAPTFFLTADATAATLTRLRAAGAAGVLNKPITQRELRGAISGALGQQTANGGDIWVPTATQKPMRRQSASLNVVAPQFIDQAVIDDLKLISPRQEFVAELLDNAADDIDRTCEGLVKALADDEAGLARDLAHALKGVCASIGASRLEWLANNVMKLPREELEASASRLQRDFIEARHETVRLIRTVRLGRTA